MKALFYFDCPALTCRVIDLTVFVNKVLGYEIYFNIVDDNTFFKCNEYGSLYDVNMWNGNDINQFDIVFYDVTDWINTMSPLNDIVKSFKNKLICINYEDGQQFVDYRLTNYTIDKTMLFINNALFKDRDKYPKKIRDKLFLTTSYITNSQSFRNVKLDIKSKEKKIHFTGSLTGFTSQLSGFSDYEKYLRLNIVNHIIKHNKYECYFKFYNCDPSYQSYYDKNIPDELKTSPDSSLDYINNLVRSMFCIAVKGNSFPTNRLHESQAAGCISLTNNFLDEVDIYGVGSNLETFVEFDIDLSNVCDIIDYYIDNETDALKIMQKSRENWMKYNMLDEYGNYSEYTRMYHLNGFKQYNVL